MSESTQIRIMVVDDNSLIRLGLTEALANEGDMDTVGEAENGAKAYEMFSTLRPDVVTMDYQMPGDTGVETARKILADYPHALIIILSVFEGEEDIWSAVQAGARGYLNKTAEIAEVLDAIREVSHGGTYFPSGIAQKLAEREKKDSLTIREAEVLELVVEGCSNKEIMLSLGISEGTAKLHVSRILNKLGAKDRTQAAIIAVKKGIVHLDD